MFKLNLKLLVLIAGGSACQNSKAALSIDNYGVFQGFYITYRSDRPSEWSSGKRFCVFNSKFLEDYVELGNLYGNYAQDGNVWGANVIFSGWDDSENTRLRAGQSFIESPYPGRIATMSAWSLGDNRYAYLSHVSTNWLSTLENDAMLSFTYDFQVMTYDEVSSLAVPEPSLFALVFLGGAASLGFLRHRRTS